MTEKWKVFENECVEYLKKRYPNKSKVFEHQGGSDSNVSDILVAKNTAEEFYIEVKSPKAQCGQFVLYPDPQKQCFIYSPKNKYPTNKYSDVIIEKMNRDYSIFVDAGTTGQHIELEPKIFWGWIKTYYQIKGVKYFITKSSEYIISPIDSLEYYFDIEACYRVKKSGSAVPAKSNQKEIALILEENNYPIKRAYFKNEKYYVELIKNVQAAIELKSRTSSTTYLFKPEVKEDATVFNVRRLSNTFNANVIFSIMLKPGVRQAAEDRVAFENTLSLLRL